MDFILVSRNLEVETESVKVPKKSERDKFQVLILGIGFILTTFLLLSHSCLSGRAGSTTNCVSAKPSWSNSAKRTYSRTTLMSWTTPAKWSSSWQTSTVQPRGLTTFPGEHRNSEQTLLNYRSAYMLNQFILTRVMSLFFPQNISSYAQNRQVFGYSCFA